MYFFILQREEGKITFFVKCLKGEQDGVNITRTTRYMRARLGYIII